MKTKRKASCQIAKKKKDKLTEVFDNFVQAFVH